MKKIIVLFTYMMVCLSATFADGRYYRVSEDMSCRIFDSNEIMLLSEGSLINHKDEYEYYTKSFFDYEKDFNKIIPFHQNKWISVDMSKLSLCDSEKFFDSSKTSVIFIPDYYSPFVQNKNFEYIMDKEPFWREVKKLWDTGKRVPFGDTTFFDDFHITSIYLNNLFIEFDINRNSYLINNINVEENNTYSVELYKRDIYQQECFYPETYLKYENLHNIKIFCEFDGDYLDIWINSKNEYMGRYYAVTLDTYKEISKLVETQEIDMSKIYYPRHADGSSDFDDEIKPPMVKLAKPGYEKIDAEKLYNEQIKTSKSSASSAAPAENLDRPPFPDKKDPDYWKILQKYYPDDYPPLRFEYLQKRTKIINTVVIPCAIVFGIAILVVLVLVIRKKRAK